MSESVYAHQRAQSRHQSPSLSQGARRRERDDRGDRLQLRTPAKADSVSRPSGRDGSRWSRTITRPRAASAPASCGVLLEVRDGRTFKVEGNPDHPLNRGALCSRGQAAVQGLYNPDRYSPAHASQGWQARADHVDAGAQRCSRSSSRACRARGRRRRRGVHQQHETGSFPAFLDTWLGGYGMPPHLSYAALADGGVIAANKSELRRRVAVARRSPRRSCRVVRRRLPRDVGRERSAAALLRGRAREGQLDAPRFVYVGPRRSLTGMNADQWIACKPGSRARDRERARRHRLDRPRGAERATFPARRCRRSPRHSRARSRAFCSRRQHGAALGGERAQPVKFGNVGRSVLSSQPIESFEGMTTDAELTDAIERMRAGQVPVLFVRGANPVFTLPKSAKVADAIAKVPFKVSLLQLSRRDDGALRSACSPIIIAIESWGDAQPLPGRDLAAAAGNGSGVRHARNGRRAVRAARSRIRSSPAQHRRAELLRVVDLALSRWHDSVYRGSDKGRLATADAAASRRARARRRAARRLRTSRAPRATSSSSCTRRRCSTTAAARTSRGCRRFPDPVTKVCLADRDRGRRA